VTTLTKRCNRNLQNYARRGEGKLGMAVHSDSGGGHRVKQAVVGMETKGGGSSRGVIRLPSSSPQDVDAERLHQLMR